MFLRQRNERVVESKGIFQDASFLHVGWRLIVRAVGEVGASEHRKADSHNQSQETVSRTTSSSLYWPGAIKDADGNHDEQLKRWYEQRAQKEAGIVEASI
jgi:hypothetical protein